MFHSVSIPLVDTNIIIEILNGQIFPKESIAAGAYISTVSVMELFALAGMSDYEQKAIERMLDELTIIPVSLTIAKRAGVLARTRKRGKSDLIIAATAIELNLKLLTKNIKDFKNIPGLSIIK